jgi:glucosyl-3-phosphoglycerate phosphatase
VTAARLIVWRHGRTQWNATGRFQGQADIGLDDLGRDQAERAAVALSRLDPARIISSDLSRAYATATALGQRCGVEVEPEPRLREINVGSWEGLTADEVVKVDPDLAHRFFLGEDVRRSATGETAHEAAERVRAALAALVETSAAGSCVVAVSHGVAGRCGAAAFVGFPYEHWRLLGGLHNCGWLRIDRHRGDYWRMEEYNVVAPPV